MINTLTHISTFPSILFFFIWNYIHKVLANSAACVEMCHETKKIPSLSYCRNDTQSLHLSECLSPSLIPALYIELSNSPMKNTMHLHRQANYQSQFLCLPTSTGFGDIKSTDWHITPHHLKITKLLSSKEDSISLVTASTYTQLACLTYRDDHTGTNLLAPMWQISRFISCPPVVITNHAIQGRPLLPGTHPVWDDRGFILGRTLICWAAICIWTAGHVDISRESADVWGNAQRI